MKKCTNGHYYNDALSSCPYCEPENELDSFDQTELPNDEFDATSGFDESTAGFDNQDQATMPFNSDIPQVNKTVPFGGNPLGQAQVDDIGPFSFQDNSGGGDSEKTIIIENDSPADGNQEQAIRISRKLVGWLVSYTLDELGLDFRLYEGKNIIGSKTDCEVAVLQDKSVSGKHATILFRNNKFLLRDEMSTNGTFLNDKIVEIDTPVINDGDIIKVGNTVFKFKVAL